MIKRKSAEEIKLMRAAGRIASDARREAGNMVEAGMSTGGINKMVHDFIVSHGAVPSFLRYNGYPASACISVNSEVIHGIPSKRKIKSGDLVSIDIGATYKGYVADCAASFIAGSGYTEAERLVRVTRECFFEALKYAKAGNRISDISKAVQNHAESNGFSVVRDFVGHGVGSNMHEAPEVPNFVETPRRKADPRLLPGMTLAIEPMVNAGEYKIVVLDDGWTVVTADGRPSAHYENTILVTDGEPEILTVCEDC